MSKKKTLVLGEPLCDVWIRGPHGPWELLSYSVSRSVAADMVRLHNTIRSERRIAVVPAGTALADIPE